MLTCSICFYIITTAPCTDGQIRLVGGNIPNEGRVEICISNEWGTICDDVFTSVDAQVVCRKLGYLTTGISNKNILLYIILVNCPIANTDALAFSGAHFGTGTGDIFLDNVGCIGTESSLLDCSYVSGSNIYCYYGHSEDVGVRCQGKVYNQ